MRIKLDQSLPESVLASLTALGRDMDSVRSEELGAMRNLARHVRRNYRNLVNFSSRG